MSSLAQCQCSSHTPNTGTNNNHLEGCLRPWYNHGYGIVQRKPTTHLCHQIPIITKKQRLWINERTYLLLTGRDGRYFSLEGTLDFPTARRKELITFSYTKHYYYLRSLFSSCW